MLLILVFIKPSTKPYSGFTIGTSIERIKDLIQEIVEKDLTRKNVKSMTRLDKGRLGQVLSGDFISIPHVLRITYQEVYYDMTRVMKKQSQLSPQFNEIPHLRNDRTHCTE
ncbi:hypothetical protein BDC45DRAFT_538587 [Circinella umbellata]|nr:hypothetical protein BDC45DRAFT_538587 [Circinella umbellata]